MEDKRIFDTDRLIPTYFRMALPVVFSMVITLIYNLADTYFIAKTNDAMLVAGVSLCAPLFTALMAIGNIYGQGGSSLISRLLGGGDRDSVRRVSSFCFYLAPFRCCCCGARYWDCWARAKTPLPMRNPTIWSLSAERRW